jgi:hypothetical protein
MRFKLYILLLLFAGIVSCKKENLCDCVKSTGPTNVIYHDVKDFTCIEVKDKINVFLIQGPVFEVRVEAGRNLQPLIKAKLKGDTLRIFNTNRCNWVRGYKHHIDVYITAPYFKHIMHNGVGPIKSLNTITQDTLRCRTGNSGEIRLDANIGVIMCSAHGNGDIYLSGKTDNLQNDYTGTNYLYANDLTIANYVYLHSVSIGHAYINAPQNGTMDIVLDRAGNIYYKGNAAHVNLVKNGKGELIQE